MCSFDRIASLLVAAQAAYLAVLAMLIIGVANAASFFAALANVPLMIAAIAGTAITTALLGAALFQLDRCFGTPCEEELLTLRNWLIGLLAAMAAFTVALVITAVAAAVPVFGAIALGPAIILAIAMGMVLAENSFHIARTLDAFNRCQDKNNASSNDALTVVVGVLAVLTIAATGYAVVQGASAFTCATDPSTCVGPQTRTGRG